MMKSLLASAIVAATLAWGFTQAHAATLQTGPSNIGLTLAKAAGGDIIALAPGAYGDLYIKAKTFAPAVTITSADPANPASIRSLNIISTSGLHFDGVRVDFTPNAATRPSSAAIAIQASSDIAFTHGSVIGSPAINGILPTDTVFDATGNIRGLPTAYAVAMTNVSIVEVSDTEITGFDRGVNLYGASGVTLRRDNIHDLRRTAIAGAGVWSLTIDGNRLSAAHPWRWGQTPIGDHADFIALWSQSSQAKPNTGVSITNNLVSQPDGLSVLGMWFQGGPASPFTGARISGNTFLIANLQAITLTGTQASEVGHNVLLRVGTDPKQAPAVLLRNGSDAVSVHDNLLGSISDLSGGVNHLANNQVVSGLVAIAP